MAAISPSFFGVERRPLPPLALATGITGQRLMDFFNLQAQMPLRRPFSDDAVGSRLSSPSGSVPGGVEVACVVLICDGGGAGPDRFSNFLSEVLCAKCKGLTVISRFCRALFVIYAATA
jgi:hypothetical protein